MLPTFLRYSTLVIAPPPIASQKREWPWSTSARTRGKWRTLWRVTQRGQGKYSYCNVTDSTASVYCCEQQTARRVWRERNRVCVHT